MKREYNLEKGSFEKLSYLLKNNYIQSNEDLFTDDKLIYNSTLVLSYYYKSEMPFSFHYAMKLEVNKDNNITKLTVDVNTLKFYILPLFIFVILLGFLIKMPISFQSIIICIAPSLITIASFQSRVRKEIEITVNKLIGNV